MTDEHEYIILGNERRGPVMLPDWDTEGEQPDCPLCRARGHLGNLHRMVNGQQMCYCCWSIFVPVERPQAQPHDGEEASDGK